ncbi:MAG: PAS domain S-box protein, partial [Deltaproteobacteria bacterium]|nr:PAS domain S-box protein [Deltaproteobacteria bacterium]
TYIRKDRSKMKILVVDDKEENRYMLEVLLKGNGHDVEVFSNGAEAFERLRNGGVELIISDILMPVMDGFQLCQKVKADEALRHIPFIIYTATYTGPQDEALAVKIGADRFILKPCEPDAFIEAVNDVMSSAGDREVSPAQEPIQEGEILKLYNERLVKKLEQKMLELEEEVRARREAEETLKVSSTKLKLALASSNIGLWEWNLNTEKVWFSPEWKRQLGYEDHEITNRYEEWKRRLHPEDRPHVMEKVEAFLQGQSPDYRAEYRLSHKNGTYRWISSSGRLISEADGNSRRFMGCHVDITDQVLANEILRASEERFKLLFEYAPDAFYLHDLDGKFIEGNRAAEVLTGFNKEELIGKSFLELPILASEERKKAMEFLKRSKLGLPSGPEEFILTRKDGSQAFVEIRTFPMKIGEQDIVLGIARDISEQKVLHEQLFQSQKLESVGRLAGGIAHDFNNLLSIILGYGQLMLMDIGSEHPRYGSLDQIIQAGMRAKNLTRQLLAFSRKQVLEMRPVDVNKVISDFERLLRRVIGEDISLDVRLSTRPCKVVADTGQLEQVFMNIAVNARDAMPDGGTLIIEADLTELDEAAAAKVPGAIPGEYVMINISDTGCGMDRETLEHIFEPFFTTKEKEKGTGLGLATSYGIIKQHGGAIGACSEPGKGTTLKIYLQVCKENVSSSDRDSAPSVDLKGRETILLVEDNEQVRDIARTILNKQGYNVLPADSGDAALKALEGYSGALHLLLTDVVMPGINGRELFEQVSFRFPGVRVLYMSGYTDNLIVHRGVLDNGVNFIQKPFTMKTLATKVREVLNKQPIKISDGSKGGK